MMQVLFLLVGPVLGGLGVLLWESAAKNRASGWSWQRDPGRAARRFDSSNVQPDVSSCSVQGLPDVYSALGTADRNSK
jgi:hypothetical protein